MSTVFFQPCATGVSPPQIHSRTISTPSSSLPHLHHHAASIFAASSHATPIHPLTPSQPRSPAPRVRVVSQPHQKGCVWVAATTKGAFVLIENTTRCINRLRVRWVAQPPNGSVWILVKPKRVRLVVIKHNKGVFVSCKLAARAAFGFSQLRVCLVLVETVLGAFG
nr:hypothetical protein [Tanacetum cinerariifolium]